MGIAEGEAKKKRKKEMKISGREVQGEKNA
jgi:hypothetical protein